MTLGKKLIHGAKPEGLAIGVLQISWVYREAETGRGVKVRS